jgi:predicted RND superfamily exporter protein
LAVVTLVPLLASTRLGWHVTVDGSGAAMENRAQRVLDRILKVILPRAKRVTAFGCIVTAALLAMALRLQPDNLIRTGVPRGTDSYRALRHCDRVFGGAMHAYVVVQWPEGLELDSPEVLQALADVHALLNEPEELGVPLSVLNLLAALPHRAGRLDTAVKYLDLAPPELIRRFVRTDLHKAAVRVQTPDQGARAMSPLYRDLDERLDGLRYQERYAGFHFHLTGSSVVSSRNVNLMIVDLCRSLGLASVVIFAVITTAFRSFRFGVLSILPNAMPLVCAAAILAAFGGSLEVAGVVTFSICLGIAVDDTVHFLSRFRAERRGEGPTSAAIERSIRKVGSALVVTTLTLLAGFHVGLFSQIPVMQMFSLLSCVALIAALAADVTVLPALLMCFFGGRDR